ncbi:MAG TPA: hypothetical protein VGE12_00845 [Noviherbaspirillum sp.]
MYFRLLHDEVTGKMSYLLADLVAGEAVVIDPRSSDVPVIQGMLTEHRLQLRWVLRTHEHDKHQPGEADALKTLGAPLIGHRADAVVGDVLAFGNEHLRILDTPGHTSGCQSYLWRDRLFCGDLFALDGCPWQSWPAHPEALWDSVTRRVFTLPNETLLFAGHARGARSVSNVLEQRSSHPWFAGTTRDVFLARVARHIGT